MGQAKNRKTEIANLKATDIKQDEQADAILAKQDLFIAYANKRISFSRQLTAAEKKGYKYWVSAIDRSCINTMRQFDDAEKVSFKMNALSVSRFEMSDDVLINDSRREVYEPTFSTGQVTFF